MIELVKFVDISTPESVADYWQKKLQEDIQRARLSIDIQVPPCSWTEEEIRRPMWDIRGNPLKGMMVYIPEQFTGPKRLWLLGQMYPEMKRFYQEEDTFVRGALEISGYAMVEAAVEAPNLDTTQQELEAFAKKFDYLGQDLVVYILASEASKSLLRKYFDLNSTHSRLLEARENGRVIGVNRDFDGALDISLNLRPEEHNPTLGARFVKMRYQ